MTSKQIKQKLQEAGVDPTKVLISNKYEILQDANNRRELGLRTQMIHRDLWFYDRVTGTLNMVPAIWDKRKEYPYVRKGRSDNKKYWIESKQWVTLEDYIGVPEPVTIGPVEEDGTREISGPRVNGKQKFNYNGYSKVIDIEERQKQVVSAGKAHKTVEDEEVDILTYADREHWLFDLANNNPIPEDNLLTTELQDELISNATLRDLYAILYHTPVSCKEWVNRMIQENPPHGIK